MDKAPEQMSDTEPGMAYVQELACGPNVIPLFPRTPRALAPDETPFTGAERARLRKCLHVVELLTSRKGCPIAQSILSEAGM